MNILTRKKINCDKYIDLIDDLNISQILSSFHYQEYHILDTSRVYVNYPFGYDVNYGDLYVYMVYTKMTKDVILEEFIIKAYIALNKDYYIEFQKDSFIKSIKDSIKVYFDTSVIPIKKEEIKIQFQQWFNDAELEKLNINFSKIKESAYIGEIDFYDEVGYQGFISFVADDKIYFVNFISNI